MTSEVYPSGQPSDGVELVRQGALLRWLPRLLVLVAIALTATYLVDLVPAMRTGGSTAGWRAVVAVAAALYAVPMAVLVWRTTSMPSPRPGTVQDLSWSLTPPERRAVARALRRGDPIAAEHRPYAIATTAAARRMCGWFPIIPMFSWCQAIDASAHQYGSGLFWVQVGVAATISATICTTVVLQLRRERSVRAIST